MVNIWGARTIVLSDHAARQVDQATNDFDRFADAWFGLEWLLARTPDIGSEASIEGVAWWVYVEPTDPLAETPEIWILYKIEKNEVFIEEINVIKAD